MCDHRLSSTTFYSEAATGVSLKFGWHWADSQAVWLDLTQRSLRVCVQYLTVLLG